jgi:hypothetical protein
MTVTLGANVIGLAIGILFNAVFVCHGVGAYSFEAVKFTSHFANVYQWEI